MFVKRRTRRVKDRTYHSYALVETVRTEFGPRHRTVCSLGELPEGLDWSTLGQQVEDGLSGQISLLGEVPAELLTRVREGLDKHKNAQAITIDPQRVRVEMVRELGPVLAGHVMWQRLELPRILAEAGLSQSTALLTEAMVLNRLVDPASEHAMPAWFARTAVEDVLGPVMAQVSDDALYRNLDRLHPQRGVIEAALAKRECTLFQLDESILLYDLTSTYFEGQCKGNPAAQRGYSRDSRPDCKQVVIGLVIDGDGFPKAHEIFPGNRTDRTTVGEMLDVLERRMNRQGGATVVVDRGMAFDDNLKEITDRGHHYLVACRQPERDEFFDQIVAERDWVEIIRERSPTNPAQKKSRAYVKRVARDKEVIIACLSEGRIEKDRAIREKHEQRLLVDLARLTKRVATGSLVDPNIIQQSIGRLRERHSRVARYYCIDYDHTTKQLTWSEDTERKAHACALDGTYLMKTNRTDLDNEEIWRTYMLLTRIEHAFRDMKSPLGERPIFHQLERRVETHIFLCLLSYHLLVSIERHLRGCSRHESWATIRDQLRSHAMVTMVLPTVDGRILRVRRSANCEPHHSEIYAALGVAEDTITPRYTWQTL